MSAEPLLTNRQALQQAIATTITCRSIIKYSSHLNAEQTYEVLTEIESTLAFLETSLAASAAEEVTFHSKPEQAATLLAHEQELDEMDAQQSLIHTQGQIEPSLQELYKLYHIYLSPPRMEQLETRYRTVMEVIDQLQEVAGQRLEVTSGAATIDTLLQRLRGFITALYCMFREFALLLSNGMAGKSIETDTEGLVLLGKYSLETSRQEIVRDISPLMSVYTKHLQLQERRGTLATCAHDAAAFFVFLEEGLGQNFVRRNEVVGQLGSISALLDELSHLLTEYEQAMATMLLL